MAPGFQLAKHQLVVLIITHAWLMYGPQMTGVHDNSGGFYATKKVLLTCSIP